MIVYVQPVTDLFAVAIYGQILSADRMLNHQRDQFFGMLTGTEVIGAICHDRGQTVCPFPGADQMIGTGFAGGIRGARRIGTFFGKQAAGGAQIAVHFIR